MLRVPGTCEPPSIGDVFYHWRALGVFCHGKQVEPVFVTRAAISKHPHRRHAGEISLLTAMYRLNRRPTDTRAAGLDLDEGDDIPLSDDEVDVMATELEAVGLDRPPARGEKGDGDPLASESQQLALVFPF
jgi:hypothetical protein